MLRRIAPFAVRLVALWVLTGAAYKLFSGSPNDLPPVVREFFLGPDLTFRLAIAIELSIAFTALLQPRLGWLLLALQLAVFLAILGQLMLAGEASCGCFGSNVKIAPATMFAIDAACLALLLLPRPWRNLEREDDRRPTPILIGLAVVAAWVAPWAIIRSAPTDLVAQTDAQGEWKLPDALPRYAQLDPETWVGKPIGETQLAAWMNVDEQLQDGTWIIYRVSCEHCARYLRHLHETYDPAAGVFYTYVRLSEAGEEEQREVDPAHLVYGPEVILPALEWVVTPPWRLELEGGIVVEAVFEGDFDAAEAGESEQGQPAPVESAAADPATADEGR
jgi:hypothetical protein